jgi:hypothetical protein
MLVLIMVFLKTTFIPEDISVCKIQERLFCERHALRALVQNKDIFDDLYLMSEVEKLGTQELIIREDASTSQQFYFNINDSYYNIQVIQKALREQYNVELVQLNETDRTAHSLHNLITNHINDVQALFIHQEDHYFCLR